MTARRLSRLTAGSKKRSLAAFCVVSGLSGCVIPTGLDFAMVGMSCDDLHETLGEYRRVSGPSRQDEMVITSQRIVLGKSARRAPSNVRIPSFAALANMRVSPRAARRKVIDQMHRSKCDDIPRTDFEYLYADDQLTARDYK